MKLTNIPLGILIVWLGWPMASAWADAPAPRPFQLGQFQVNGSFGLNIAGFGGEHAIGEVVVHTRKIGFAVSGSVNLSLNRYLAIGAGLIYSDQGARISIDGEDRGSQDMSYLHVPLLLQARAPLRGRVVPYGLVGSALGFLLSAEANSNQGTTTDVKDQLTSTDVALAFGLGTSVVVHRNAAVLLEARYMLGLIRTPKDGEDIKNRVWTFSLGYQHRFGR